jgi:hypothetical protein
LFPQVAQLFEDFARRAMANPEEKLHAPFVAQLRQAGLLNLDDVTDRMLRILVELAVNHCLQVRLLGRLFLLQGEGGDNSVLRGCRVSRVKSV